MSSDSCVIIRHITTTNVSLLRIGMYQPGSLCGFSTYQSYMMSAINPIINSMIVYLCGINNANHALNPGMTLAMKYLLFCSSERDMAIPQCMAPMNDRIMAAYAVKI